MSFAEERIYGVGEVNALVRETIETDFSSVAIAGEISNLRIPASGHLYFKLKDAEAQLSAVCFRGDARRAEFVPEDGMQVVARGNLTVYEPTGNYQMIVRALEPAGRGELERALRLRVEKLRAEGLFDESRKRSLPRFPRRVAVITSPTGAAVRDITSTLRRRFRCVEVLVVPVQVQGEAAPAQIVRALDIVSGLGNVDVVILGRGGGSAEDLSAFNDEGVARAIHRCTVPVISAVGHEIDVTIADFVADARAATPTMAAEIAVPAQEEVLARVAALEAAAGGRLVARIALLGRRVAELSRSYALGQVHGRIERGMQRLDHALDRMGRAGVVALRERSARVDTTLARMAGLDPRDVLRRGYAAVLEPASGRAITSRDDAVRAGDVRLVFEDGAALANVRGAADKP
jgi:exodeoxyribonuclease VII large subunit